MLLPFRGWIEHLYMYHKGLGFIQRYKEIRKDEQIEEVDYNFGRLFHQLGE